MDQGRQAGDEDDAPDCHRFRSNEARLWLSLIAYNLGNLWRRLVLPKRIANWSLTSLQQRVVKTGGRLIKHARYYWLLLAESHLTRRLFGSMVRRSPRCPRRRVGEPMTGSDFREERGREAAKCRKHGSKEERLRPMGFSREARMAPSVARESALHCKLDSQLHWVAVRSIF